MAANIETQEIKPFTAMSILPSLVSLCRVLSLTGGGSIFIVFSDKDGLGLRQEHIFELVEK